MTVYPNCSFSASPASVVPPQAVSLSWQCYGGLATSCSITPSVNGQAGSQTTVCGGASSCAQGSYSVNPAQNTSYTLTCGNSVGSFYSVGTVYVTTKGPGTIEVNPGG